MGGVVIACTSRAQSSVTMAVSAMSALCFSPQILPSPHFLLIRNPSIHPMIITLLSSFAPHSSRFPITIISSGSSSNNSIMKSAKPISQEPYVRSRDNPYYDGLLRNPDSSWTSQSISRSASDISNARSKKFMSDISHSSMDPLLDGSVSNIVLEPIGSSPFAKLSKIAESSKFTFPSFHTALSHILGDTDDSTKESSPQMFESSDEKKDEDDDNDDEQSLPSLARPVVMERSYSLRERSPDLSKIPLPRSAATFYQSGFSLKFEIVESCRSARKLNSYLKTKKDDVSAGVPGKFLHVVLGQDTCDCGSIVSTITYAFYLNETHKSDEFCTVPVINMKRVELSSRAELKWLLASCQIDESFLVFIDEIDLSYYDLFGSLKLVLLNGDKLPTKQEALKEAVVEIFNGRKEDSLYPGVETITVGEDSACCTLVAEKFAITSPEILADQGFSRLLLAAILLDTGNLSGPCCTSKDKYMATLLINGAGRFGINGLYHILRYKMYDVSGLKVIDILRKDFKKWTRIGKTDSVGSRWMGPNIGMSSIGISVEQLLAHERTSIDTIKYFQQLEKLQFLMIVSGYYDSQKNFKREILVAAESIEFLKNLLVFFNLNASNLPLRDLHRPGLKDEMRAFEIDQVTSRKTIEHLLEEFGDA